MNTMNATRISNTEDVIDVRDIIARVEELEDELEAGMSEASEVKEDMVPLVALLDELKGNGGDEQWRGDWYPITLIRDSYFRDYAEELAEDCGMVNKDATWPNNCIDWERAARELRMDYTCADFGGVTYWYR